MSSVKVSILFSLLMSTCMPTRSHCTNLIEQIDSMYAHKCCYKERMQLLLHADELGCFDTR